MCFASAAPTMQLVLGEITVVGNLIGTNPDLTDLIALAQQGKVVLHSTRYVSIPK
jgi:NAD+-dependent secondary alcohol dehydrogenase Adh1